MRLAVAGGLAVACSAGAVESSRWYVNASAQSSRDGLSWKTAFASLQTALEKSKSGDEIWVARGTYIPHATDRNISFQLKKQVSVYGGFAGNETALTQRDIRKNPTVLSGNIGKGDKTKNTVTILKGADGAVLDGFIISDSYSTDKARMHLVPADIKKNDMAVGGGMRNFKVSPIVRNCIFKNNYSPKGGAVYNVQDSTATQAQFINVEFIDNAAQIRGGAVSNDLGAMPFFINCSFTGNSCADKGGAIYNDFAASPILLNCLIQSNRAVSAGGIGNDGGSSPLLVNVTIAGNEASSGLGAGLYQGTRRQQRSHPDQFENGQYLQLARGHGGRAQFECAFGTYSQSCRIHSDQHVEGSPRSGGPQERSRHGGGVSGETRRFHAFEANAGQEAG